jgi:ABC-type multidrug transport system ATPase subunit
MQIKLTNTGKRYNREWIFRHFSYEFLPGKHYAITGPNGSGKSTLLQVIGGSLSSNEGTVVYDPGPGNGMPESKSRKPDADTAPYPYLALAAPYLELIEEMTALEMLHFHARFKTLTLSAAEILTSIGLEAAANKQIRNFSSGMKQRLKLAQAFFSMVPVLLLDEPTTNLDEEGIVLYHRLINRHAREKLVIVSSNDKQEYAFCEDVIDILKYKTA